jgi:hypothetical protein
MMNYCSRASSSPRVGLGMPDHPSHERLLLDCYKAGVLLRFAQPASWSGGVYACVGGVKFSAGPSKFLFVVGWLGGWLVVLLCVVLWYITIRLKKPEDKKNPKPI